jgi:hypothetical protein
VRNIQVRVPPFFSRRACPIPLRCFWLWLHKQKPRHCPSCVEILSNAFHSAIRDRIGRRDQISLIDQVFERANVRAFWHAPSFATLLTYCNRLLLASNEVRDTTETFLLTRPVIEHLSVCAHAGPGFAQFEPRSASNINAKAGKTIALATWTEKEPLLQWMAANDSHVANSSAVVRKGGPIMPMNGTTRGAGLQPGRLVAIEAGIVAIDRLAFKSVRFK